MPTPLSPQSPAASPVSSSGASRRVVGALAGGVVGLVLGPIVGFSLGAVAYLALIHHQGTPLHHDDGMLGLVFLFWGAALGLIPGAGLGAALGIRLARPSATPGRTPAAAVGLSSGAASSDTPPRPRAERVGHAVIAVLVGALTCIGVGVVATLLLAPFARFLFPPLLWPLLQGLQLTLGILASRWVWRRLRATAA